MPTPSPLANPEHWRKRAKEAREVAEAITDPESKGVMLKIAENYEKLALRAAERVSKKGA
jgi:hypothetical protein